MTLGGIAAPANAPFDVCVIGAGATGAGCALDARSRGFSTLLIDAADFASETSSTSTKLVHGGVRYLQQAFADRDLGQYNVVKRALAERSTMLANAPYLARPLRNAIPCFNAFDLLYYGVGLNLYDAIAGKRTLEWTRVLGRRALEARMPRLKTSKLLGGVLYSDGQFDDARYNAMLALSAGDAGARVRTYARAVGFERDARGRLTAVHLEDALDGSRSLAHARTFVNATGPFSDRVRHQANPALGPRLRQSKGVHVLLPLEFLGSDTALLIPKTTDGRVIFALPWQGRLLVGTTDDEADLTTPLVVTEAEIAYLLDHLNAYLTQPAKASDVVGGFAGLRPLVRAGGAVATQKLIRDHEVEVDSSSGLISVLGGKWTTYRAMAEDAIDSVAAALGRAKARSRTASWPLRGARGYAGDLGAQLAVHFSIAAERAEHLARTYGTRAAELIEGASAAELEPIVAGAPALRAQVGYSVRAERARTLDDIMARRIGLERFGWNLAWQAAPIVAEILVREAAWPQAKRTAELEGYRAKLERLYAAAGWSAPVEAAVLRT